MDCFVVTQGLAIRYYTKSQAYICPSFWYNTTIESMLDGLYLCTKALNHGFLWIFGITQIFFTLKRLKRLKRLKPQKPQKRHKLQKPQKLRPPIQRFLQGFQQNSL